MLAFSLPRYGPAVHTNLSLSVEDCCRQDYLDRVEIDKAILLLDVVLTMAVLYQQ